jgi:hypothetical protein
MNDAGDLQYVSLMSTPFSGSTLLSMLLCSQPRSIGFGDTYFGIDSRPENLCTCGETFLECQPRCEAQDEIRQGGLTDYSWGATTAVPTPQWMSVRARHYWPLSRAGSLAPVRQIPTWIRRRVFRKFYLENHLMLAGLAKSGRYDFYFDGCKDPVRLELMRTELSNLKIIHMVRHPAALVYHSYRLDEPDPEGRLGQWLRYHTRVRSFLKYVGNENYLPVTYEDVVGNTGSFLREVADFVGMDEVYDSPPYLLRRSEIHIQGNKMRKTADRVLNMANKWRGKLPPELEADSVATLQKLPWAASMYESE